MITRALKSHDLDLAGASARAWEKSPCPGSQGAVKLGFALNHEAVPAGCDRAALNFELTGAATAPEWIELIPAGQVVVGRDGRTFLNDRPQDVIAAFSADARDMPLDWEHATELQAPQGLPAPAAGWIRELNVREGGSIWGRVEWTDRGRASVTEREYRYISPVIMYEQATGAIRRIGSVGLTNRPNLALRALNQQSKITGDMTMTWKELLKLLGLAEDATEAMAINAVEKIQGELKTALNSAATPSLDKFVPRADYDAALSRATNAEQALATKTQAELDTAIEAEVGAALAAGKITPATVEYHKANCRQDGGLERFRQYAAAAPVIADPSGLDGKKKPEHEAALNAQERETLDKLGLSVEDYRKYNPARQ